MAMISECIMRPYIACTGELPKMTNCSVLSNKWRNKYWWINKATKNDTICIYFGGVKLVPRYQVLKSGNIFWTWVHGANQRWLCVYCVVIYNDLPKHRDGRRQYFGRWFWQRPQRSVQSWWLRTSKGLQRSAEILLSNHQACCTSDQFTSGKKRTPMYLSC